MNSVFMPGLVGSILTDIFSKWQKNRKIPSIVIRGVVTHLNHPKGFGMVDHRYLKAIL